MKHCEITVMSSNPVFIEREILVSCFSVDLRRANIEISAHLTSNSPKAFL